MSHRPDPRPWYWSADPAPPPSPALQGERRCEVVVIGGGLAGVSAALELAERGREVVLLEAGRIGEGASGRNGGQVIAGYAASQSRLASLVGPADARRLWDVSAEALALVRERIARHGIDCDWRDGHLHVAVKPRQATELREWAAELRALGQTDLRLLDAREVREEVRSERYVAGLLDPRGGHLDPLRYLRGLAAAARAAGVSVYEDSRVVGIAPGEPARVRTSQGEVRAAHVLLAGNASLGRLVPALARRIIPVHTSVVVTEPLGAARARALIPGDLAVADMNWVLDYFRLTRDHRLLFGGPVSYSGREPRGLAREARRRLLRVFPQLADVALTHAWGGTLDLTANRAPDFNRLGANLWYLQGFSGHGLALTGIAGRLAAEAITGQPERFEVFARIPHRAFPGGALLRRPALVLAMAWYRLRDLL